MERDVRATDHPERDECWAPGSRARGVRRWCCACVLLLVALEGPVASADTGEREKAREHFVRGKAAYEQGLFEDAVRSFEEAAKLQPSPLLDYNLARCHERLGQSRLALETYRRYLEALPEAPNRKLVEARMGLLERELRQKEAGVAPVAEPPQGGEAGEERGTGQEVGGALEPPPAPGEAATPLEPALPGSEGEPAAQPRSGPEHEAEPRAPRHARAGARPAGAPRVPLPPPPPDDGPIYKKWYFWVAIAGAVAIAGFIIGTAATSDDDRAEGTAGTSQPLWGSPGAGPVPLLTF